MRITINTNTLAGYQTFLKVRTLPTYRFVGHDAIFPDEYAERITGETVLVTHAEYVPIDGLFDYQRDIAAMAIEKRKFAVFADCGLGKTLILLEFARHCNNVLPAGDKVLIISPLMVVGQTAAECAKWYSDDMPIAQIKSGDLQSWLDNDDDCRVGITNYEALKNEIDGTRIGCLILDESSMLKSHYGHYGTEAIRLGEGVPYKLALTGTPAPNDRIEYANHAVFVDAFRTTNEFLATFFINRGQTQERWALKPHGLRPFYRSLSHWAIFLTNPAVYGWSDNCESIPPIHVHIHHVEMSNDQGKAVQRLTGGLFANKLGGITTRAKLAQIAKGKGGMETLKPAYIADLVETFGDESTIIWCIYNEEQDGIAAMFPGCANIDGSTQHEERIRLIDEFKAGRIKVLVSKPKILGFGLNLQVCTRMVFSGLQDSYESYYQAVKRANRYGSTKPLNVHIPVTEVEIPMVDNVLEKAKRVQADSDEQEALFRKAMA